MTFPENDLKYVPENPNISYTSKQEKELETEGEFDDFLAHRDEDTSELDELLKVKDTTEKGDPMDFPPDYTRLVKELNDKGGIKIENCQEVNMIQYTLYEAIKDEEIREACLKLFTLMLNYSNLWIIHYNLHKVK